MIGRYTLPAIGEVFTDSARMAAWLEIEILTVEALCEIGKISEDDAKYIRSNAPFIDDAFVAAVNHREEITNHDLAAFVDVVQSRIGMPQARWIHYGLTSSDVVDTGLSVLMVQAGKQILELLKQTIEVVFSRAQEFAQTVMVGRTHGMHAEPTTFGNKLSLWALALDRDYQRLSRATASMSVGKLSGAVGTYSNIDPRVEAIVCERLGLTPVPATQVIGRDRHAEFMYALTSLASTIEMCATEVRHLARTEVGEAEEYFAVGQKGSSAMPHKRNPILSERLVGLSRVMRGYLISSLEDVALWHERDISHSSVERIVVPDAAILGYYMLAKFKSLVEKLVVYPKRMLANLDASHGLVFSQSLLLALIDSGQSRDDAYRIVQRAAQLTNETGMSLKETLDQMDGLDLDQSVLDRAFDLNRIVKNANLTILTASKIALLASN